MTTRQSLSVGLAVFLTWLFWPQPIGSHITTTNTVLFDREIVEILDRHCVVCHAPRNLAEPLVTYEEAWLERGPILAEVLDRHMPPWAAVQGYGSFTNDNSLTLRETQFLISWVEGLGPRNDGAVFLNVTDPGGVPGPVEADANFSEWELGEPDLLHELPETVVEPDHGERIERLSVDLGTESELWVRGLEFKPGDRRVVRAATFKLEGTGQWLGSWTPWHGFVELPEGAAYRLPPNSRISAEIYYGTSEETIRDRGTIGLALGGEPAEATVGPDLVLVATGVLRPDMTRMRLHGEAEIASDTRVWALWPEFETGIESVEVSVRRPDGGTDILLFAKDIPTGWPTPFILTEPVLVGAGSRLRVTAYYGNESETVRSAGIRLTVSRY